MAGVEISIRQQDGVDLGQDASYHSKSLLADVTQQDLRKKEYGYELFRRAIMERDEEAWEGLFGEYEHQVVTWIWTSSGGKALLEEGLGGQLMTTAFAKLAQSLTPAKFLRYETLGALLQYLKGCSRSAVRDEMRLRRKFFAKEDDLSLVAQEQEPRIQDTAEEVLRELTNKDFWRAIANALPDQDDRLLVYLLYWLEMKIEAIHDHYSHRFPTQSAIRARRRNLLLRLRRNHSLRRALIEMGLLPLVAGGVLDVAPRKHRGGTGRGREHEKGRGDRG